MTFNFEVFTDTGVKLRSPAIMLSVRGGFTFNSAFYREHSLNSYEGLILSYDKTANAIGFAFKKQSGEKGIFTLNKRGNMGSTVAKSFFNSYKIDPAAYAGTYPVKVYEDQKQGKIFYIELEKSKKSK